jgi:hypothetical protein
MPPTIKAEKSQRHQGRAYREGIISCSGRKRASTLGHRDASLARRQIVNVEVHIASAGPHCHDIARAEARGPEGRPRDDAFRDPAAQCVEFLVAVCAEDARLRSVCRESQVGKPDDRHEARGLQVGIGAPESRLSERDLLVPTRVAAIAATVAMDLFIFGGPSRECASEPPVAPGQTQRAQAAGVAGHFTSAPASPCLHSVVALLPKLGANSRQTREK